MKKLLSVLVAMILLLTCISLGATSVGAVGTKVGEDWYFYTLYKGKATIISATVNSYGTTFIPSTLDGYPVVAIDSGAFTGCTYSIDSLVIPDSITSIGSRAFAGLYYMSSVKIGSGVTEIGDYAFNGCHNLSFVDMGNSVITIGDYAFNGCSSLSTVLLGEKVTTIGESAFRNCDELISITIPNCVKTIGNYAFADCAYLCYVTFGNSIETIGDCAFYDSYNLMSAAFPDSLVSIGGSAFLGSGIYSVDFGKGVKTIGAQAFLGCAYLTSVNIPKSVTTIGASAFSNCYNVETIEIPDSVTFIGSQAFSNTAYYNNYDENWENDVLYIGNHLIDVYNDITGDYKIKNGTKTISESAFYDCFALTSISIPDSISAIESRVFSGCDSLTTVTLPKSVTAIGDYAFYDCENLKTVYILGILSSLGDYVFDECYNLTDAYYVGTLEQAAPLLENSKTNMYGVTRYWHSNYVPPCKKHSYAAATCTKAKTCKVCGATSGKKLGHDYEKKVTKATTSKDGVIKNVCKKCGYTSSNKTTIYKASKISLSKTSYTYNGKVQKPSVVVKDSKGKTISSKYYTVTYATGCKNAGTYKVTVKFKGNYSGTKTLTYKIKPIDVSKCKISLSTTSYTYNGKAKKPSVTVKSASGTKLTNGTHYTVTYASGRKNVGTYKVTVKMKGNYTGTKTLTFKVNPVKTSISKLTAGSKKLTVKWTKKSPQVTGYQIQYSTSKSFKSYKTKTVSSYKTTSATLSGLSTKKTYYVRVRTYKTVNGKKVYSGWSTIKYLKTK